MPRLDRLRRPLVPALDLLSRVPRNTRDAAPGTSRPTTLPSLEVISDCVVRGTDMGVLDVEDITANYPETLRRWRAAFLDAAGRADQLGYDRRFRRLWELYFRIARAGSGRGESKRCKHWLARPGIRGPAPRRRAAALLAGS
jgi:hypothetical protein